MNEIELKREELRDAFGIYLKACCGKGITQSPYNDLSEIDECLKGRGKECLYDINTIKDLDNELQYLEEDGLYNSLQEDAIEEQPQDYTDVLNNYRKFLDAYKFAQEWVKPHKLNIDDEDGFARNTIVFGAPGTGKSHSIKNFLKRKSANSTDVTFHPDSDYASFVGCYKPTKDADGNLTYEFVPQAFINAYINAWRLRKDKIHVLRIEEINRGNCAQIFGDIFQLLDRYEEDSEVGTKGCSKYTVDTDTDLMNYLKPELAKCDFSEIKDERDREDVKTGKKLILPSNLWILATMNTSDQSLYPMDSAFKRRWEWKYIPISYDVRVKYIVTDEKNKIGYNWWEFLQKINSKILDVTKSEDKQLGFWFTGESQTISISSFVNKVLFYLWNDVFKDYHDSNSPFGELTFQQFYGSNGMVNKDNVITFLKSLGMEEKENVVNLIEGGRQKYLDQKSKAKSNNFVVTYNGEVFNGEKAKDTFIEVIQKIGPERIQSLGRKVYNGPFIVSDKEELNGRDSVELKDNLFLLVGISNKDKKKILSKIKKELSLDLDFPNENPD